MFSGDFHREQPVEFIRNRPTILQCSKGRGRIFRGLTFRSNIMRNLHFHQPAPLSAKAGEILSVLLVVLSGALALVTLATS